MRLTDEEIKDYAKYIKTNYYAPKVQAAAQELQEARQRIAAKEELLRATEEAKTEWREKAQQAEQRITELETVINYGNSTADEGCVIFTALRQRIADLEAELTKTQQALDANLEAVRVAIEVVARLRKIEEAALHVPLAHDRMVQASIQIGFGRTANNMAELTKSAENLKAKIEALRAALKTPEEQ